MPGQTSTRLKITDTPLDDSPEPGLYIPPEPRIERPRPEPADPVAVSAVLLALRVLTDRLFTHLLPLIVLGMGFWLWLSFMQSPTPPQLVGFGLFGAFSLALVALVRRK